MPAANLILQLPTRMYLYHYPGLNKYNQEAYDVVMDMFDSIPLACILNRKFLCVHGGISHDFKSVPHLAIIVGRC